MERVIDTVENITDKIKDVATKLPSLDKDSDGEQNKAPSEVDNDSGTIRLQIRTELAEHEVHAPTQSQNGASKEENNSSKNGGKILAGIALSLKVPTKQEDDKTVEEKQPLLFEDNIGAAKNKAEIAKASGLLVLLKTRKCLTLLIAINVVAITVVPTAVSLTRRIAGNTDTKSNCTTGETTVYLPCDIENGGCEQNCTNIDSDLAHCSCYDGYILNRDGKTCEICRKYIAGQLTGIVAGDITFEIHNESSNWFDAHTKCHERGATLWVIPNQHTEDCILQQRLTTPLSENSDLWLGLKDWTISDYDYNTESNCSDITKYTWEGNSLTHNDFQHWAAGEPSATWEPCVLIQTDTLEWENVYCDEQHNFVCQAQVRK